MFLFVLFNLKARLISKINQISFISSIQENCGKPMLIIKASTT